MTEDTLQRNVPVYKHLACQLDTLPEGFPATESGVELRLLAKLFTPEEAALAAHLSLTLESAPQVAGRAGVEARAARQLLKDMVRRGLITAGRIESGLGFALLPFVVGFYEMQAATIDAELAQLFEVYYHEALGRQVTAQPSVHRVIPIGESVHADLDIQPFESAAAIVKGARAWGVTDCICRKQQALIGEPCDHPLDVCMVLSDTPGAFGDPGAEQAPGAALRPLTQEGALATLQRAANAGLVHSVSNTREGISYICNCCTCACGILRGMADLGLRNVVAPSTFVNRADPDLCIACGACVARCSFGALALDTHIYVDALRCVGCGACIPVCPTGALHLEKRPEGEMLLPPETMDDWRAARDRARKAAASGYLPNELAS
ncbi:MAG: 4Fe-4S binding protein [Anaerolineae bacterium]|nr:4Fe-4S binding protein [Anaerolineae bacterium]